MVKVPWLVIITSPEICLKQVFVTGTHSQPVSQQGMMGGRSTLAPLGQFTPSHTYSQIKHLFFFPLHGSSTLQHEERLVPWVTAKTLRGAINATLGLFTTTLPQTTGCGHNVL